MKLIKKVSVLEVKRVFAMTPILRKLGIAGLRDHKIPTREQYLAGLKKAKIIVDNMSEGKLNRIRGLSTYNKRLRAYNACEWYLATVSVHEIGTWRGACGLPLVWTRGSLFETVKVVKHAIADDSKKVRKRLKRALPAVTALKDIIRKDTYLLPIVFKGGTGTRGRKRLPKMKVDIDDGNMRAIALALSGAKTLRVYYGKPKLERS